MIKYFPVYTLLWILVLHTSCKEQNQKNVPQDNIKSSREEPYSKSQQEAATSKVPNSMVRNVKQARNGDILIAASWSGVFRYDGKSFTNLTNSKIGSHRFWDVLEDRRGNLWFASTDSGVYNYNGKTFQHFTTREGLANNTVMKIYEDKAGNIWFATAGGGASRYDGNSFRNFTTKEGLSSNDLTTIMEDKTGKLWFGTRGEPCFYDGKTFTVFRNKAGKAFNNVQSIIEDRKGSIWFGDVDGLWRYEPSDALRTGSGTFTKVSQKGAYAIIEDKKGNIWTTGADEPPQIGQAWSLSRYDAKSLYNKKPTVTEIMSGGNMDFLGILEANDGSIWFGSGGGVYRYDGKTIMDFKNKDSQ
ncbi:two-component regulator propeller domain-containing protein [Algoriphagus sp. D3-2-R+10]|uniref:ligand-binding sensor domain-containing protein n=1 Tax=Algoriphagus aurantiacus TaxID=3103948 RepID=UPI002B38AE11|nr:two-component regulator propeller domain-containing protein [Algoriphagus sp. D3-2-R+10]MEB2774314.1 two-component regulator propeller domain-containing protein [Algoriphagus sp. D3-2-R+10]